MQSNISFIKTRMQTSPLSYSDEEPFVIKSKPQKQKHPLRGADVLSSGPYCGPGHAGKKCHIKAGVAL